VWEIGDAEVVEELRTRLNCANSDASMKAYGTTSTHDSGRKHGQNGMLGPSKKVDASIGHASSGKQTLVKHSRVNERDSNQIDPNRNGKLAI
jgi:hypothetical protein